MSDLIDREEVLQTVESLMGGAAADELRKALPIASPLLPDDVQDMIKLQRDPFNTESMEVGLNWKGKQAADMIEKLAWRISDYESLRANAKKLTQEVAMHELHATSKAEQIEALQAKVKELEKTLKETLAWKSWYASFYHDQCEKALNEDKE